MSSRFWTWVENMVAGQTARAEQVNGQLEGIDTGFANVAAELNRSIRFMADTPSETAFQLNQTPAQRANMLLGFTSGGDITLRSGAFTWRGDWTGGTLYNVNDMIRAPSSNFFSLYVCTAQHIASTFATDLAGGFWAIAVDMSEVYRFVRRFQLVTTSRAVVAGDDLFVDTSAGTVSLTLPASPSINDQPISVCHVGGSNPINMVGNGNRIMGLFEDMTVSPSVTPGASFELAFCDASRGWRLVKGT